MVSHSCIAMSMNELSISIVTWLFPSIFFHKASVAEILQTLMYLLLGDGCLLGQQSLIGKGRVRFHKSEHRGRQLIERVFLFLLQCLTVEDIILFLCSFHYAVDDVEPHRVG